MESNKNKILIWKISSIISKLNFENQTMSRSISLEQYLFDGFIDFKATQSKHAVEEFRIQFQQTEFVN